MIFQQLLNEESGCLSYLIGCAEAGRAVVVDPGRDRVHDYVRIARKKGLTITDVVETHTHADHISGNRDLAAVTKAAIHVHGAAGLRSRHATLAAGSVIRLGNVELKACHAPGHPPDSICLLVTDHARAAEPWFVLTGDTLFVGSVGRPDLGGASAAEDLGETLRRVLLPLSDGVEVYPAHGAGSSCGRAMSAKAASTIGFERRFNPAFHFDSKARFVDFIMEGMPPKPAAFETIVAKNRGLLPLTAAKPRPMSAREAWEAARAGAVILDLRDPGTHGETHPAGALNVWIDGPQFPERVAGFVSPGTRVIVLAQAPSDVDRAVQALSRVGVDDVIGYLQWGMIDWRDAALPVETVPQISAWDLHTLLESGDAVIVDVREPFEWLEGHVEGVMDFPGGGRRVGRAAPRRGEGVPKIGPGAPHPRLEGGAGFLVAARERLEGLGGHVRGAMPLPMFEAVARAAELPADRPKAVVCAGGLRSSTTISALKRRVPGPWFNVTGGMGAWLKAGYGVTRA